MQPSIFARKIGADTTDPLVFAE